MGEGGRDEGFGIGILFTEKGGRMKQGEDREKEEELKNSSGMRGLLRWVSAKESPTNAGEARDAGLNNYSL